MSSLRKIWTTWFFPYQKQIETSYDRLNFWDQYWTSPHERKRKDQNLSEIIDMLRRSKKSSICFPPRQEASVHPPAWTLTKCQALWGAIMSQFLYQKENCWEYQNDRPQWHVVTYLSNLCKWYFIDRSLHRVAKYLGYDGYIRVKIFADWGKKVDRTCSFAK